MPIVPPILEVKIRKENNKVTLTLKANPALEEFFKEQSKPEVADSTSVSSSWKTPTGEGVAFYRKSDENFTENYYNSIVDDFGVKLFDGRNGRTPNVALLRCVGITEGVTLQLETSTSFAEVKSYVENIASYAKHLYETRIADFSCEAIVVAE